MPTLQELVAQERANLEPTQPVSVKRSQPSRSALGIPPKVTLQDLVARSRDVSLGGQAPPRPIADPTGLPQHETNPVQDFARSIQSRIDPTARIGQGVGGVVGSIAGPLALGALIPGPLDEIAMIAASMLGAGSLAFVGDVTQSAIDPTEDIDLVSSGAGALAEAGSDFVGGMISKGIGSIGRKLISSNAMESFARGIPKTKIGKTQAGKTFQEFVGKKVRVPTGAGHAATFKRGVLNEELNAFFEPAFKLRNQLVGGGGISMKSIQDIVNDALMRNTRGPTKIYKGAQLSLLESIAKEKPVVDFDRYFDLRNLFQEVAVKEDFSGDLMSNLARTAKQAQVDPAQYVGVSPNVAPKVKEIHEAYSGMKDLAEITFNDRFVNTLRSDPQKVIQIIGDPLSEGGVRLENIKNTKAMLMTNLFDPKGKPIPGGKKAWDDVRYAWWESQIDKYSGDTVFDVKGFGRALDAIPQEARKELFEPGEMANLKKLTQMVDKKNVRLMPITRGTAALGITGFIGWDAWKDASDRDYVGVAKDGGILLGIGILARAASSKKYAGLVSAVLRAPPMRRQAINQSVRLVRALKKDEAKEKSAAMAKEIVDARRRSFERKHKPQGITTRR